MTTFGLHRIKRRWCPEWLWWIACNPIPFWNDMFPLWRVSLRPAVWLLSQRVPWDKPEKMPQWMRKKVGIDDNT